MGRSSFSLALLLAVGCQKGPVERVEWVTMDTVAAVQCRGRIAEEIRAVAQGVCEEVVGEFSAFDSGSAINRLGRCTPFGQPCWDFAMRLRDETNGAFDPRWKHDGSLDFGAVAKGFAVDLAGERLLKLPNLPETLVDLGGNLKALKGDWTVGVQDGDTFTLRQGEACATSAKYYRGEHIRNAATGKMVANGVYSVTVIHPSSAMVADGLSTVLFILGRERGEAFLRKYHPEAKAVWINAGL